MFKSLSLILGAMACLTFALPAAAAVEIGDAAPDFEGKLVYKGAIDSDSSADPATIESATNYVSAALAELKAGKPVTTSSTQAYGCAVKY